MNYQQQQKYFSQEWLQKYEQALGGNTSKVHRLYKANIRLAQSFYPLLTILEVALRNAIDKCLIQHFNDPDWIRNQVNGYMSDPLLGRLRNPYSMKNMAIKTINKNHNRSHGKLISDINFGFWTEFFEKKHYGLLQGKVDHIFSNKPSTIKRNNIYDRLNEIRRFRNRVAHHEPVCFKPRTSTFDLSQALKIHQYSYEVLEWLDLEIAQWPKDIDTVNYELLRIDAIRNGGMNLDKRIQLFLMKCKHLLNDKL